MQSIQVPGAALAAFLTAGLAFGQDLEKPVQIQAAGKAVDTDIGHAAPCMYDFDRDGKRDLLVGQFGGGKMKIFRNIGTNEKPEFAAEQWFEVDGTVAAVPEIG